MAEYEGKNSEVTLGDDVLTLASKGGGLSRRIPYGAIKDVLLKDAGALSEGILWLVLGDKQPPKKVSAWAASGEADAVTFSSGKQAQQFKDLHAHLLDVVNANRAAGVDPASITYDTIETALALSELSKLSLRSDVESAASRLSETPKVIRKSLKALSVSLTADECVLALTAGGYGSAVLNSGAVLAITEQRVLVVRESGVVDSATMSRELVESVTWQQGTVGGRLDVFGAGRAITLRGLDHHATSAVVDLLSASQPSSPVAADVISQLERLSALRDSGALTHEEFDQQKARILGH